MGYIDGKVRTFTAGADLGAHIIVTLSGGNAAVCDATEQPIGVTEYAVASGEAVAVRLLNSGGTVEMVAGAAITSGADVYCIAAGKIDDSDPGSGIKVGIALEAATADGDIIEVLPYFTV